MNRGGGGGEKSLLCDPGSKVRAEGREKGRAKTINGMGNKIYIAVTHIPQPSNNPTIGKKTKLVHTNTIQ